MMPWTYDARSQRRWVRMLAGMGFEVWGGTGPDRANIAMWAQDIVRGGGHGLVATLWKPLDKANAGAQRALVADSGRMFPRKEGSGT
jgi:hypothetical protein